MKKFDKKRLRMSISFMILVIILLVFINMDLITNSRYESKISSTNKLNTAIYLLNDEYQTIQVKLPDVLPDNNQYTYTFSISNYDSNKHSDTNLKYNLHIRTTTNMPLEYELYKTLDIDDAESCIVSNNIEPDQYGTYFRNILTDKTTFLYTRDEIDYYTLLLTFPDDYTNYSYSGLADYIEINVISSQILESDNL